MHSALTDVCPSHLYITLGILRNRTLRSTMDLVLTGAFRQTPGSVRRRSRTLTVANTAQLARSVRQRHGPIGPIGLLHVTSVIMS
jgi:hypothetical protein